MSTEQQPTTGHPGTGDDPTETLTTEVPTTEDLTSETLATENLPGETLTTEVPASTAPTGAAADEGISTTPPATASDPQVAAQAAEVERPERGPRVGTVVWGLVLAVLGVGVLAWAGGRRIDVDVAAIVLVAGAGVALLIGSIISGTRRRR
ncbi:MAG: hypothetical protein NVV66_05480 [Cellulomonas sp.]|uniref:hypothetical protein n=1 Tax=Cellulomonas sp. TaxID=40001 RepID=UPI0025905207|nr:hypothetical protein [Cellulomonas sp.]MCR6704147.1 hypothetical protein [Cellulomonas sp.]